MEFAERVRLDRTAASSRSGHRLLAGWWGRQARRMGTVVVLAMMLAGMLPAWQTGGAVPARALPATKRATVPVIIEVAQGANPAEVARGLGVVPTHVYSKVFEGFAAELPAQAVRAINRQRGVLRIWPDLPVRAEVEGQTTPTGVKRINANQNPWADIGGGGPDINADVAVLDTGISAHDDLNVQPGGKSCVGSSTKDGNGHGTHVAGTIAARDNGIGVVGVAPGARLWPVKVLGANGVGSTATVICGLEWVYDNSDTIDVVNMSLSAKAVREDQRQCGKKSTPLHKAICRVVNDAGIPVVVAAGNDGRNASKLAPATYDEVITVSAFTDLNGSPNAPGASRCSNDVDDTFACFSNFGEDIDIAAPGVSIRSTWLQGGYNTISGTSMATPHVTGAIALYIANELGPDSPIAPQMARDWLRTEASQPQDSNFGFTGDPDDFPERVLYLPPP